MARKTRDRFFEGKFNQGLFPGNLYGEGRGVLSMTRDDDHFFHYMPRNPVRFRISLADNEGGTI